MLDTRPEIRSETLDKIVDRIPMNPTFAAMRFWNEYKDGASNLTGELEQYPALKTASLRMEFEDEIVRPRNYAEILNPTKEMVREICRSRERYSPDNLFYAELVRAEWDYSWLDEFEVPVFYRFQSGVFLPENEAYVGLGFPAQICLDEAPECVTNSVKAGRIVGKENTRYWVIDIPDPSRITLTPTGVHIEYHGREPAYLSSLRHILEEDALILEPHRKECSIDLLCVGPALFQ